MSATDPVPDSSPAPGLPTDLEADVEADVEHVAPDVEPDVEAELEAVYEADVDEVLSEADHPTRSSRWWSLPLRLLVSAAMIWFLVKKIADVSFADLLPTSWTAATVAWAIGAVLLTLAAIVLATARWKQVLDAMRVASPPFSRLVSHYFAGQFVSNVLPTTIGGDVLRASRLAGDTGDGPDSFASLVIERLAGWLVLPLLCVCGFALNSEARNAGHPATVALLIAFGTVAALIVVLIVADHPRLGGRFKERQGWRRFIGAVHLGVSRIRTHPGDAAKVVAAGMAYQIVLVVAAYAGAQALGIQALDLTALLAFFPAVLIAQILPIGISGLGVREGALVYFLTPLGVPKEQAVALGLLVFGLNLVVSLLGAPAFISGSRRGVARKAAR